jgi:hypothetical protein
VIDIVLPPRSSSMGWLPVGGRRLAYRNPVPVLALGLEPLRGRLSAR